MSANGDLRRAHDIVTLKLVDDLASRIGVSRDEAQTRLTSVGFDVARAVKQFRRDNPPPEVPPLEQLAHGAEVAALLPHPNPEMRRYAHVIPHSDGYELRLVTHLARYTKEAFGWDYDCAIRDASTRLQSSVVDRIESVIDQLEEWGCTEELLMRADMLDSCLANSPLEPYLDLPHLRLNDEPEIG